MALFIKTYSTKYVHHLPLKGYFSTHQTGGLLPLAFKIAQKACMRKVGGGAAPSFINFHN